jgi:hypothetical protein
MAEFANGNINSQVIAKASAIHACSDIFEFGLMVVIPAKIKTSMITVASI